MLALTKMKALSPQAFAELGRTDMAYVKAIGSAGTTSYAIHAADGTHLWQFADRDTAFAALRQHNIEPVSVH